MSNCTQTVRLSCRRTCSMKKCHHHQVKLQSPVVDLPSSTHDRIPLSIRWARASYFRDRGRQGTYWYGDGTSYAGGWVDGLKHGRVRRLFFSFRFSSTYSVEYDLLIVVLPFQLCPSRIMFVLIRIRRAISLSVHLCHLRSLHHSGTSLITFPIRRALHW